MFNNRWLIYNKEISSLKALAYRDEILTILVNRGIENIDEAKKYINLEDFNFHDPFLLKDMDLAVERILDAIDIGQHIHIVGDYDQDGNSATVVLVKGIRELEGKVTYAIPDRVVDGYGINPDMIDRAKEAGVDLIITCDNGIVAFEAVEYAKNLGIDVIVTDHHQLKKDDSGVDILPKALAVLNPHREDAGYPCTELCGAGVAFKLVQALHQSVGIDEVTTNKLLQFACMGTICDVVDLRDENRLIVKKGLELLNNTDNLGVINLIRENSWNKSIDTYCVGFVIGPCINASGRLSTARLGIELFIEEDEVLVANYARELVRLNNKRKELTSSTLNQVVDNIERTRAYNKNVIIEYADSSHESIVGIVAGRIKDKYNRPTVVFADSNEEGIIKGSGRSLENYNMYEKFAEARELMTKFGGHAMACGLSIEKSKLAELDEFININSGLTQKDFIKYITIDCKLDISEIDEKLLSDIKKLEPFGKGNEKPVFADKNVEILNYKKYEKVVKLNLMKNGKVVEAVAFGNIDDYVTYLQNKFDGNISENYVQSNYKKYIDLIYYPQINEFRGNRTIQLNIVDIR